MKKKFWVYLLVLLLVTCISACGDKKVKNSTIKESESDINGEDVSKNEDEKEVSGISEKAIHYNTGMTISKEESEKLKNKWIQGLTEEEQNKVEKLIFEVHSYMESMLVYRFKGNDCSPESAVWNNIDDDPNDNVIEGYTGINMIDDLKQARQIVNKESFSILIDNMIHQLETVIDTHDIDLLYEIHQEMHDLSYWAINYPVENLYIAPADWSGINVYFGTLDKVVKE